MSRRFHRHGFKAFVMDKTGLNPKVRLAPCAGCGTEVKHYLVEPALPVWIALCSNCDGYDVLGMTELIAGASRSQLEAWWQKAIKQTWYP